MSKAQIVESIVEINPSAPVSYLMEFPASALRSYLERLMLTREPRGGSSVWVRPGGDRSVVDSRTWRASAAA